MKTPSKPQLVHVRDLPLDFAKSRTARWLKWYPRGHDPETLRAEVRRDLPWIGDAQNPSYLVTRCLAELARPFAQSEDVLDSLRALLSAEPFGHVLSEVITNNGPTFASAVQDGALAARALTLRQGEAIFIAGVQAVYGGFPYAAHAVRGQVLGPTWNRIIENEKKFGLPCLGALVLTFFFETRVPGADHELEVQLVVSSVPRSIRDAPGAMPLVLCPALLGDEDHVLVRALLSAGGG